MKQDKDSLKKSPKDNTGVFVVQEGRNYDQVIVKDNNGKIGIIRDGKLLKKLKPGDVVKGIVITDKETFFVFRPLEILEKAKSEEYLKQRVIVKEGRNTGVAVIELKGPAVRKFVGKFVEVLLFPMEEKLEV